VKIIGLKRPIIKFRQLSVVKEVTKSIILPRVSPRVFEIWGFTKNTLKS